MEFKDLTFVRLTDPSQFNLIPQELFTQVKGADYDIGRLYQLGPLLLASPLTYFYVLVNSSSAIKGLLWAEINPLNNTLNIHAFSADKEYQQKTKGHSTALDITLEFLRKIQKEEKLDSRIEIVTLRPKAYEKAGWKTSKKILMEI